ncbi:3-phosphoshikimate 1-carboxyvinyltransferase [Desulfuromonas soudanensis]|uniref:3-phosphoshikimate 1-carboxyvinyltransferase n=1 Tax=Desulfuromonas soudanensis TaxID=1603606 RepID=A0A0M4DGT5_9BACT|nr:3-phosphoshikimate 1-carboxyvinyltransferase [Desulfuromonas soudanensis]ALC16162.1 3-phosphoshikimate 1-carboxyvinyltransferase [Desulfuromonas soudanensis]
MIQKQTISPSRGVKGDMTVPGDKSISHRSIMLGSLAEGVTEVHGFLHGEDNHATLGAFRAMGVLVDELPGGVLRIHGRGLHGLAEPGDVLDCGNSGTTIRLMTGLLSGQNFFSVLTGDRYLRKRPMKRVVGPLAAMGARIWGRGGGDLAPLAIQGGGLAPADYDSPIASAQVKSALLLAGLYAEGVTTVREPHLSRDHSERMLGYFGADVRPFPGGVSLVGHPRLTGREVHVPGDISSAAFFMVAALITPGSELLIRNVGVNPTRSGIIDILQEMGGSLQLLNERELSGEPVADILVKSSDLKGIEIGGSVVPRAIDEFPVVSVAAAFAEGTTIISDARELRVKETDRIAAMTSALGGLGARVEARDDGMVIHGGQALSGGTVSSRGDHRIAMSMAVAALRATGSVTIEDTGCTATSFPDFWELIERVGA